MQDDLFGHTPQQAKLFDAPESTLGPTLYPRIQHTPETIRALMHSLLEQARAAPTMPWTPREVRSHTAMFPYMAEWLPKEEGEQLLLDFRAEMERLKRAA